MVGHKFMEALKEKDPSNKFNVVTFCEEKRAAYNRMRLTEVGVCILWASCGPIVCSLEIAHAWDRLRSTVLRSTSYR